MKADAKKYMCMGRRGIRCDARIDDPNCLNYNCDRCPMLAECPGGK